MYLSIFLISSIKSLDVLIVSTIAIFVLTMMLLLLALVTKFLNVYFEKQKSNRYRIHTKFFVTYIAGDRTLEQLDKILNSKPFLIHTYLNICKDLQFNVRGTERERIQNFLDLEVMRDHYTKMVRSKSEPKIIKGLNYFRELEHLKSDLIEELVPLLRHKKIYIRQGAATAMMACEKVKDRGYALENACREKELTRLSLYELLYKFRNKDKEQWEQEGKFLMSLLLNEEVLNKHKSTIAIAMGGMGYYYESSTMLSYLKEQPLTEDNAPLVAGLIEGLGMLKSPYTIDEIERIITQTDNSLIKKASMNALREINGKEGIGLLFKMLGIDYEPQVQIDSAIEIIKLDMRSLESISSGMIPENANKDLVSKIESETGHNFYLKTA